MAQSYRGLCQNDKASQLSSNDKGRDIFDVKRFLDYTRRSNTKEKEKKDHYLYFFYDCYHHPQHICDDSSKPYDIEKGMLARIGILTCRVSLSTANTNQPLLALLTSFIALHFS
jgi:hypothetical protein